MANRNIRPGDFGYRKGFKQTKFDWKVIPGLLMLLVIGLIIAAIF